MENPNLIIDYFRGGTPQNSLRLFRLSGSQPFPKGYLPVPLPHRLGGFPRDPRDRRDSDGDVIRNAIQPTRRARLGDACGISRLVVLIAEAVGFFKDIQSTASAPFPKG